jgi:LmbE family N-acetylglucosaminyl deacetylase
MRLENIPSIHRHYDHVYVSPHFDDVAASCGGKILEQKDRGESVLVVTVFTGTAPRDPASVSNPLKPALDYPRRRREDDTAMQRMGVDHLWLEHPEVLFRTRKSWARYQPHYRVTPTHNRLCDRLRRELQEICGRTECADLMLPLGVGQHMDHQISFQAGAALLHGGNRPYRIAFYEEIPYAMFGFLLDYRLKKTGIGHTAPSSRLSAIETYRLVTGIAFPGTHRAIIKPWAFLSIIWLRFYTSRLVKPSSGFLGGRTPVPTLYDITPFIEGKIFVISAYASQLTGPLADEGHIRAGLSTYARGLGMPGGSFGERCWMMPSLDVS